MMKIRSLCATVLVFGMMNMTPVSALEMDAMVTESELCIRQELIDEASNVVRQSPAVTDGVSDVDHSVITQMLQQSETLLETSSNINYSGFVEILDLASTLSIADGLTLTQIGSIFDDGVLAFNEADGNDAFRHFTWNFRSTISVGVNTTKIFTNNYEWANVLVDDYNSYVSNRYDYYYDLYFWSIVSGQMDAFVLYQMAVADADDYIVALRNQLKLNCADSYSYFCSLFGNAGIMDFWNNYYGRSYGNNYPTMSPAEAYEIASINAVIVHNTGNGSFGVTTNVSETVYHANFWR